MRALEFPSFQIIRTITIHEDVRNRRRAPNIVEPELRTIVEVAPMADNRTMEEATQHPREKGYEKDVPNDVIKLMMFPYSLEGAARVWYDKEPPNSILTWEDLVTKCVESEFFLPRRPTSLKNTILGESSSKTDERIDKFADQNSTLVEIVSKKVVDPATVKAVEESCVTCIGPHAYYNCPNTDSNQSNVCAATSTYNQVAPPNCASNHMAPPDFSPKIMIDPNPERFINEPALVCLPPSRDDDDDKGCDLPFCDNNMIFSNPLFGFNDDNYNSSNINPLFNEILEDVENEDSNVSNFDEPVLLNIPLFDEDECFDPGGDIDEIDAFLADAHSLYNDLKGVVS
ncbi:hypothetical protein Tco_0514693 [Tanacetum coccineum]